MSTTSPPGARTTLDSGAYTDPAWFGTEMERIYTRMWLAAGRAAELDAPGAFVTRDVGFVFEDAIESWDRTNREDWAVPEQSYLGISSRGYQPGPYSAREQQLWEFDQFVLSRTGEQKSWTGG